MKKKANRRADNYLAMPIIHQQVAGIDIGSQFHVVAVGEDPKQDGQQFSVSTAPAARQRTLPTSSVADRPPSEARGPGSYGGYQQPLVNVRQEAGFEV